MIYLGFLKYGLFIENNENLITGTTYIDGDLVYYQFTTSPEPWIRYLYVQQRDNYDEMHIGEFHTFEINKRVKELNDIEPVVHEFARCLLSYQKESIKISLLNQDMRH